MLKGVACSLSASMLFGYIYYFSTMLVPLTGEDIFAFRIIFTLPFIWAAVFLFRQRFFLKRHFRRIKKHPWLMLVFLTTASITGFEMWLFLWAPNNNEALNVSVGYLILPLMLVLMGRIFFKEKITRLKLVAILLAALGVATDIFAKGGGSWTSAAVCGYAVYFLLRKRFNIMDLASLAIEFTLLLPVCIYFGWHTDIAAAQQVNPHIMWRLVLLGLLSGTAFIFYILASNLLPMNMLGLLSYMEPTLLLISSIFIGEKISSDSYPLFAGLLASIFFVILDGVWEHWYRAKQQANLPLK
ncbi:permease [Actinobacillus delphinicola]|uniref:Permease n=1 Tax=Actinobacillus delphinicola TaxID=51161 RepID=A0A448TTD9_9PAST|nr:EamA family transporter RarD [Actinobacillus delphinicola]MDG6897248.1 permease [Actinobacillus delphinicola]VEJ09068.1 permease [Actinobacillus delphinicola]